MGEKRYITCPEPKAHHAVNIHAWCRTCENRKKCWGNMKENEMLEYGVQYPEMTKEPPFPEE